jgi:hypothetical protein
VNVSEEAAENPKKERAAMVFGKNKSRPQVREAADKETINPVYEASLVTSEGADSFRCGSTIFMACQS